MFPFAADLAPTLGAIGSIAAVVLASATAWAGWRAKRAQRDVDAVKVTHDALVGTINQMEAAMRRQDVEHQHEIDRLNVKIARIEEHHRVCEARRSELAIQVEQLRLELEARR